MDVHKVLDEQIHRAIKKMKPYKATRSGTIPNSVLIHAREELVPHLGLLFRATNMLMYYPQEWALTETLILKKLGKPDYMSPSAWHPIVLQMEWQDCSIAVKQKILSPCVKNKTSSQQTTSERDQDIQQQTQFTC